jgi:thiol-disulfide isomerase/thioredoxin
LEFSVRMILLLLAVCALCPAVAGCDRQKPVPQQGAAAAGEAVKGVDRSRKGAPAPAMLFNDPDGEQTSIAAFAGKPLLINLWASWCAPCVKELPTLDRLAASNRGLAVVAVSQDMAPQGSVEAFLAKLEVTELGAYHDPKMGLSDALGVRVMPTTVLYDRAGREVWRYVGDLDWNGAEARALLAEAA